MPLHRKAFDLHTVVEAAPGPARGADSPSYRRDKERVALPGASPAISLIRVTERVESTAIRHSDVVERGRERVGAHQIEVDGFARGVTKVGGADPLRR